MTSGIQAVMSPRNSLYDGVKNTHSFLQEVQNVARRHRVELALRLGLTKGIEARIAQVYEEHYTVKGNVLFGVLSEEDANTLQEAINKRLETLEGKLAMAELGIKTKDLFLKAHGEAIKEVRSLMTLAVREHCAKHVELKSIHDEYEKLWVGIGSVEDLNRTERELVNYEIVEGDRLNSTRHTGESAH